MQTPVLIRIGSIETNTPSGTNTNVNRYCPVTMPSSPIATRKTPAIFMITISRWTRGRFLIVWISCLYVSRGALRALSVTGGEALSVTPHRPREFLLRRRVPRAAPPIPPRFSVLASEGEASGRVPRARAAGQRPSSPESGRPVSEARRGRARGGLGAPGARGGGSGAGGGGGSATPRPPPFPPTRGS